MESCLLSCLNPRSVAGSAAAIAPVFVMLLAGSHGLFSVFLAVATAFAAFLAGVFLFGHRWTVAAIAVVASVAIPVVAAILVI